MYKKYTYKTDSGTHALGMALNILQSKNVIIPTYTCINILNIVKQHSDNYLIVDCGMDLQILVDDVIKNHRDYDTVIVPHMFGIRADIESIRKNTNLKIIEDLSQCHGLPNLGIHSDIVVSSTNKSKWIDNGGGGFLFTDNIVSHYNLVDFSMYKPQITKDLNRRNELALEVKNAGIKLIGNESSYLRGMYFTEKSAREPYIPLHKIEETVGCFTVNSYIGKVDWISIKP